MEHREGNFCGVGGLSMPFVPTGRASAAAVKLCYGEQKTVPKVWFLGIALIPACRIDSRAEELF
jgi:hypothetical protein